MWGGKKSKQMHYMFIFKVNLNEYKRKTYLCVQKQLWWGREMLTEAVWMNEALNLRLFLSFTAAQLLKWGWERSVRGFSFALTCSLSLIASLSLSASVHLCFFYSCMPKGNEQPWERAASVNHKNDITSHSLLHDPTHTHRCRTRHNRSIFTVTDQ